MGEDGLVDDGLIDNCPNCGFHVALAPRERRHYEQRIAELEAELLMCHSIMRGGADTLEKVAYIYEIPEPPQEGV